MTTPHAPEGGKEPTRDEVWESLSPEDRAAIERGTKAYYERWAAGRFPPYEEAVADDEGQEILCDFYRDLIGRPIALRREKEIRAAARAEGATAERARLAGMASEEDRAMVERVISVAYNDGLCDAKQYARKFYQAERLGEALLARLAAARGEALQEAAKECDDKASGLHALARIHTKNGSHEAACAREEQADCAEVLAARIRALAAPPATAGEGVGNG